MPHSHYVMDLYYPLAADKFRREVLRIEAANDDAAMAEGLRIDGWRKPAYYVIRGIQTPARAADRVIYTSPIQTATPAVAEAAGSGEQPVIALND